MKSATLLVFALLCAAQLYGVPVNGELIIATDERLGTFTLNGPNFFVTASLLYAHSVGSLVCTQGCGPGDVLIPGFIFDWDILHLEAVTVDGVAKGGFLGNIATPFASSFFLNAPIIPITNSLVYTAPVTIDGFLIVYPDQFTPCILCQPDQFPLLITGSGQVTITLRDSGFPPGLTPLILDQAVYQFVPEPSTFLLFGVPLAICFVRRLCSASKRLLESLETDSKPKQ